MTNYQRDGQNYQDPATGTELDDDNLRGVFNIKFECLCILLLGEEVA